MIHGIQAKGILHAVKRVGITELQVFADGFTRDRAVCCSLIPGRKARAAAGQQSLGRNDQENISEFESDEALQMWCNN